MPTVPLYPPHGYGFGEGTDFCTHTRTLAYPWPIPVSITTAGEVVYIPRPYRVPLMFLAKFQWKSLRLVLTSSKPEEEWKEYKFDIVHISKLCQHLFEQARKAMGTGEVNGPIILNGKGASKAKAKGTPVFDKTWRSPMFDHVLTRFYHHWFISREWSLKNFHEEFNEEEYEIDVLKYGMWNFH